MYRAKSRIKKQALVIKKLDSNEDLELNKQNKHKISFKNNYFKHLPTLIISFVFLGICLYILTNISPQSIKHFILPNSYLPFLSALFLFFFFFFSFLLLNTRRGFFASLVAIILIFLRVQEIDLSLTLFAIIVVPVVLIEVIYSLVKARS